MMNDTHNKINKLITKLGRLEKLHRSEKISTAKTALKSLGNDVIGRCRVDFATLALEDPRPTQ